MSEGLPLRPAAAADVGAIRSLTREAYSKWVSVIGREPKPMTADYAEAVEKHCIDLLYFDGKLSRFRRFDQRVGFAILCWLRFAMVGHGRQISAGGKRRTAFGFGRARGVA